MPDGELSSGRRLKGTIPSTIGGYAVTTSWSQNVNTVSRCIAARVFGQAGDDHPLGGPGVEQVARHLGDCLLRGPLPMPITTTPLPIGITSPPSSVATP